MLRFVLLCSVLFAACNNPATDNSQALQRAMVAFDDSNFKQAILQLDRILEENPKNDDAKLLKARALFQSNRTEKAIALTSEIVNNSVDDHEALAYRSIMYSSDKDYKNAKKDIFQL